MKVSYWWRGFVRIHEWQIVLDREVACAMMGFCRGMTSIIIPVTNWVWVMPEFLFRLWLNLIPELIY